VQADAGSACPPTEIMQRLESEYNYDLAYIASCICQRLQLPVRSRPPTRCSTARVARTNSRRPATSSAICPRNECPLDSDESPRLLRQHQQSARISSAAILKTRRSEDSARRAWRAASCSPIILSRTLASQGSRIRDLLHCDSTSCAAAALADLCDEFAVIWSTSALIGHGFDPIRPRPRGSRVTPTGCSSSTARQRNA